MDRSLLSQVSVSVGLYFEGLQSLNKLPRLWEAACSAGFDHISVDVFAWAVPRAEYTRDLNIANFVSDSVIPLETLCKSMVLRVLVPESYNASQKIYLDEDLFDLRVNRVKALRDPLRTQVEQCKLFCVSRTRPVVVFAYGQPEHIFRFAEQIVSFIPDHPDSGHEIILLGEGACEEFWIHIPLGEVRHTADPKEYGGPDFLQAWAWWHSLKASVNYSDRIGLMVELSPNGTLDPISLEMWLVEPVRSIVIPVSVFCTDENGHPTLPPAHKEIVSKFLRYMAFKYFFDQAGVLSPRK